MISEKDGAALRTAVQRTTGLAGRILASRYKRSAAPEVWVGASQGPLMVPGECTHDEASAGKTCQMRDVHALGMQLLPSPDCASAPVGGVEGGGGRGKLSPCLNVMHPNPLLVFAAARPQ